jgi:hypothetical protein
MKLRASSDIAWAIFLMLIRFSQEGHSTVVFSSGMIRKLGTATGFQKTPSGDLEFQSRVGLRRCIAANGQRRPVGDCGIPQRQTSLNGSGDIAV